MTPTEAADGVTIEDFVMARWQDAKEAMREVEPEFVERVDLRIRLEAIDLHAVGRVSGHLMPTRSLSKRWHRLLEECVDLVIQERNLRLAASEMAPEANTDLSPLKVGRQNFYHFYAFFLLEDAFAERMGEVIRRTTAVYVEDTAKRRNITAKYERNVREQLSAPFGKLRNRIAHARRLWARALTEREYWEMNVAIGLTPMKLLDEFIYEPAGQATKAGEYRWFEKGVIDLLSEAGHILNQLADEVRKP